MPPRTASTDPKGTGSTTASKARGASSALRDAQKAATRDLLSNAALEVFNEKSYVEVTIDDIIQAAGTSRATFYLYFTGKSAVLNELVRKLDIREDYQVLYRRFAAMERPSVEGLQMFFDEYVDFYTANLGLHRAIHQAQTIEPEFTEARVRAVQEYIELWQSLGYLKNPDSAELRAAAVMTFALAAETMYLWLVNGIELDRDQVTRTLAESFYATLTRG